MSGRSKSIGLVIFLLIFIVPAVALGWFPRNEEKIINGQINIDNIYVGGMEADQARKLLEEKLIPHPETKVKLIYQDQDWEFEYAQLGIKTDVETALKEALSLGRRGSAIERIQERWAAAKDGKTIVVPVAAEKQKIQTLLKPVTLEIQKGAQNAKYIYHNKKVEIIPHADGISLNIDKTIAMLLEASKNPPSGSGISVNLPVEVIHPQVTSEQLKEKSITTVTGAFTTYFNTGKVSRSKNIGIAVKYLDGTVVPPGATFSFNKAVGPRTKGAGFEEALIIVDKEFVPGVGGGVCQVSSTLYNAALRSGMKIQERSRHSKIINYVPVGLDAAVSYGYVDFRFVNTTEHYIAICAEVHGGALNVQILGEQKNPYTIEVRSVIENTVEPRTEYRNDSGIAKGKEYIESPGRKGHVVKVERLWYQDGKEIKREVISRDFYPAEARVIVRGSQQDTPVVKGKKKSQEKDEESDKPPVPFEETESSPEPDINPEPKPGPQHEQLQQEPLPNVELDS